VFLEDAGQCSASSCPNPDATGISKDMADFCASAFGVVDVSIDDNIAYFMRPSLTAIIDVF
jgi:hypothetical protein